MLFCELSGLAVAEDDKPQEEKTGGDSYPRRGVCVAAFDLLTPDYVAAFRDAVGVDNVCDVVDVAIHENPHVERPDKPAPVLGVVARSLVLQQLRMVGRVVSFQTRRGLREILLHWKPRVRLLVEEGEGEPFLCDDLPMERYYASTRSRWSAAAVRRMIYEQMRDQLD